MQCKVILLDGSEYGCEVEVNTGREGGRFFTIYDLRCLFGEGWLQRKLTSLLYQKESTCKKGNIKKACGLCVFSLEYWQ